MHRRAAGGVLVVAVLVAGLAASAFAPPTGASVAGKGTGSGRPKWLGSRTTDDGVTLRVSAGRAEPRNFPPSIPTSCFPDLNVLVGVSTTRIAETLYTSTYSTDPQPSVQTVGGSSGGTGGNAAAQVVVARVPKATERVVARFSDGTVDEGSPMGRWAVLGRKVAGSTGRSPRTRVVRLTAYGTDDEVLERATVATDRNLQILDVSRPECRPTNESGTTIIAIPSPPPLPEASGPPPADEAAAHDAVVAAVEGAYAAGGSGEASLTHVQDGDSAAVRAAQETSASRNEQYRGRVAAKVSEVKFLDDREAAVRFELLLDGEPFLGSRVGFVVLTDDGWKLSRSTYCAVLSAGGGQC